MSTASIASSSLTRANCSSMVRWPPIGAFGVGILEVANEAEARDFSERDLSVRSGLNRWEIHPMFVTASRAKRN